MSKTVDERVVELRFDNQQFERNVHTSMSTLEKLKQSLNFKGAANGLEGLEKAAKNTNLSGLGNGVDAVHAKFSALQVMGVTALARITNSAITAGERIAKALTIDPIKSGFQEYETQINAVQTILANTQKEGTTIKDVNAALDELNLYADKTIYNFTEMTRNIGTFTAAGVKLDTSVNAIQGIANLAAVSGSTSQQASTAMYQLSQALAAGTVKLMDWNSVVNAGMGGQVFQDSLKETARVHGIAIDQMIKEEGSFRETLSKGWLTSEILTETLQKFTLTTEGLTEAQIKQNREMLKSKGYTDDQIDEIFKLGKTATDAATKVKTFTQLWDVLKEAAQSGWAQTWRLIVGDFEEAKSFFTDISVPLTNLINKMSEGRNKLLESALGKGFSKMGDTIRNLLEPAKKAADTVKNVKSAVSDLGGVVDDVILGKFGNGKERFDALSKAGHNFYEVQNKVNEKLGDSFRYTKEQISAQDKVLGKQKESTKSKKKESEETTKLTKEEKNRIKSLMKMSEEQLRSKGYTDKQIAAFKELGATAKKLGMPMDEFIDNLEEINGRWLLLNSIKNVGTAIAKVFTSIGNAWKATFAPMSSDTLFNIIAAFHRFTASLILSDDNAKKLKETFQGLFSVIHILTSIFGGGLKLALTVVNGVLKNFDMNILDLTSAIGRALTSLDNFIFKNELIKKSFELIGKGIETAIEAVEGFFSKVADNPIVKKISETFSSIFDSLGDKPDGTKGLVSGIQDLTGAMDIGKEKANNFKTMLEGIRSAFDIQNYKFIVGLTSGLKLLNAVLQLFGTNLFDIGSVIAGYVTKFAKFIDENTIFINMTGKLGKALATIIEGVSACVDEFLKLEVVKDTIKRFKDLVVDTFGSLGNAVDSLSIDGLCKNLEKGFKRIQKWIQSLKDSDQIGIDIIKGLVNGLRAGAGWVTSTIINIATAIIDTFKAVLGIHSPARKTFEIGVNIMEGLLNGIKALIGKLLDGVSFVADKIVEVFKNFDFEVNLDGLKSFVAKFKELIQQIDMKAILSMVPVAVTLLMAKRLYDLVKVLENGIKGINGVIDGFANIENALAGVFKSMSQNIKAKALKNIAIAIAILVGSIVALTFVNQDNLMNAVFTIVVLAGVLVALAAAMKLMESASVSIGNGGVKLAGLKTGLVAIGASILMLAAAVRIMGTMNWKEAKRGFIGLSGLVIAIAGVFAAYGLLVKGKAAQNIDKAGAMLLKMSVSLLLLTYVCKQIGQLTLYDMVAGAAFLTGFVSFVSLLCYVTQGASKGIDRVGGVILKISVSLLLMVGVCKLVGMLQPEEIGKGIAFAIGFTAFIYALIRVTQIGKDKQIAKLGGLLLSVSVSLILMVGVCKLVGMLKPEEVAAAIPFVAAFAILVYALVNITKIGKEEQMAKVAATILAFSIAIGILAGVCILLSMMTWEGLAKGIAGVGALSVFMAAMIAATRGANNVKANLIVMTIAIAVMAGAIAILSTIDPARLLGASVALGIVMGMFALVTKYSGQIKTSVGTLAIMAAMIVLLSACLYKLAELPFENTLGAAAALSILMLSFSKAIQIMGGVSSIAPTAMGALVLMSGIMIILGGVLLMLQNLPVESAIAATASLSILLLVMVSSLLILQGAVAISPMALVAVGVMTGIVALLAVILYQLQGLPVESTLANATALSMLLIVLTGVTVALSAVGLIAPLALAGVIAFGTVVAGIGGLIALLGGLVTQFPQLEEFLNAGLPILSKIGQGIGSFFGTMVSAFADGAMGGLSTIATELSDFVTQLQPFLDGIKGIDVDAINGVQTLATMIATLAGDNLLETIVSKLTGTSSMESFGTQLVALGKAMNDYAGAVAGLDTGAITASASAAKAMVNVANSLENSGGAISYLTGDNSLSTFGTQLVPFGLSMRAYSLAVTGLNVEAITASASAAKAMVNVANALGNSGGAISYIMGDNDLGTFGSQLTKFGKGMNSYSQSVSGIDTESIKASAAAAKAMVNVANSLENSGGAISYIVGDNDLGDFGAKLKKFGKGIKSYSESVSGIDIGSITDSVKAAKAMVSVANSLPKEGGLKGLFKGKADTTAFTGMSSLGKSIKGYSNAVTGVNVEAVSNSASAVKKMVSAINSTASVNTSGVKSFKSAISSLASTDLSGLSKTFNASASRMASAGSKMTSSLAKGLKSNTSSLTSAASSMVNSVQKAVVGNGSDFSSAGKALVVRLVAGINSQKARVSTAMSSTVSLAAVRIRSQYSNMHSAGAYLGTGLVNGINSKKTAAYNAGYALGKAAVKGEKDGQKSNSPSKLTIQAGKWLGEGLVIGMKSMGNAVYKAGNNMGSNAANSMTNAISTMSTLLEGGIDAEPSIRPVLDLSDIKSGVGTIDSMMNKRFSLAAGVDIDSVGALMSQHNQNGGMDDVVSAINGLRKEIGKTGNVTNIIDGVSYDDGSNLNDAIETIVRVARMGRRV